MNELIDKQQKIFHKIEQGIQTIDSEKENKHLEASLNKRENSAYKKIY